MPEDAVAKPEGQATGQEPAHAEGTPPPETVSLKDFLAHKEASRRRESKYKAENEALAQQLKDLTTELEVLKQTPNSDATDDEIKAVKMALLRKHKEFEKNNAALAQREKDLQARERKLEIQRLCADYKVKPEDIEDAEDPEKEALKLFAANLQKEATKGKGSAKLERGSPDRTGRSVAEYTPEEFQQHLQRLKREAALKH